jgi:hypothetical protein
VIEEQRGLHPRSMGARGRRRPPGARQARFAVATESEGSATELLTIPGASRKAGVGVHQLRKATKRGELAVYKVGAWPRVRWREVLRWIDAQRVRATPHAERRVAGILAREAGHRRARPPGRERVQRKRRTGRIEERSVRY